MTILPRLLHRRPLSLPTLYVASGVLLFLLPLGIPSPAPITNERDLLIVEYISELIVIISLSGAGLKIDREFGWKSWMSGWRLLMVAMPLSIIALSLMGYWILALAPASAILLGAVLAPTDPVLAEDVQVGPPQEGEEDDVRFGLTLEAGLNDGLAFPFVFLAIAAVGKTALGGWTLEWFAFDFLYRIGMGLVMGYVSGRILSWYFFNYSSVTQDREDQKREGNEGPFIIAAILLVYSLTEFVSGYGFLAVFVSSLVGRRRDFNSEYNLPVYRFVSQMERLLLAAVLIGFGGILTGGVMQYMTAQVWIVAAVFVLIIRPIAGYLSFIGSDLPQTDRIALAFFGVRGIGSLFYLAFALSHADFMQPGLLWAAVSASIVISVVLHGVSVSPVMGYLDRTRPTTTPQT